MNGMDDRPTREPIWPTRHPIWKDFANNKELPDMTADLLYNTFRQPSGYSGKLAACLRSAQSRQRSNWMVEQLNVQPYQHILEIGYGSGNTLQEVARKLKIGFLAGIDHSTEMYKQA